MAKIGFIGLGHMGLPMAINLIKAGHEVSGFDLQEAALSEFAKAGGKTGQSPSEMAAGQDVLITMLQTGEQVSQVCLKGEGLFSHARPNTLYIDCSSIDVQTARELHLKAEEKALLMVDAPVSGGVNGAANGTLTLMVGGEIRAFKAAEPILKALGQRIIHTGKAGSGQAAKICNNMILGISMIAVSEAYTLANRLGLAPEKLSEVVNHSSGQCWVTTKYPPVPNLIDTAPANHNYQPGFTAAMMLKDLNLSQNAAHTVQLKTSIAAKATSLYQQFVDQGQGQLDFSAIIKTIDAPMEDK